MIYIPVSEAKKRANKKWDKNNLKRLSLAIPIETFNKLDLFCKNTKVSKNSFIKSAIDEKLERDGK